MADFKHYETIEQILIDDPKTQGALLSATAMLLGALTSGEITPSERDTAQNAYDVYLDRLRQIAVERHLYETRFPKPVFTLVNIARKAATLALAVWLVFMVRRLTLMHETFFEALRTAGLIVLLGLGTYLTGKALAWLWTKPPQKLGN
jgi:hypothetical protein